ncbi:MAG TPA: hypothetical protein VK939_08295 [Longimicrobiales bacterium]|nr:hypothetical protein [Longimicrobiales bacterium]
MRRASPIQDLALLRGEHFPDVGQEPGPQSGKVVGAQGRAGRRGRGGPSGPRTAFARLKPALDLQLEAIIDGTQLGVLVGAELQVTEELGRN